MTDKELLSLATEFDGGMQPIVNGHYVTPEHIACWSDNFLYHDFIHLTVNEEGLRRWKVRRGGQVLNKKGYLEYEGMPSGRTDKFLERTRFNTVEEAFEALRKFHEKERKEWVKKIGRGQVPSNMAEENSLREAWKERVRGRAAKKAKNSTLQPEKEE
jgi:hypothetical protein